MDQGTSLELLTADKLMVMEKFAESLFRAGALPEYYKNAPRVMMGLEIAKELGTPAVLTLNKLYIVGGKFAMEVSLQLSVVRKSGAMKTFKVEQLTSEICTISSERENGESMSATYTIDQARKAGLVKEGSGWAKNPEDMLFARAAGRIMRRLYSDILFGLYSPEEADEAATSLEERKAEREAEKSEEIEHASAKEETAKPKEKEDGEKPKKTTRSKSHMADQERAVETAEAKADDGKITGADVLDFVRNGKQAEEGDVVDVEYTETDTAELPESQEKVEIPLKTEKPAEKKEEPKAQEKPEASKKLTNQQVNKFFFLINKATVSYDQVKQKFGISSIMEAGDKLDAILA
jgi:hypothetical protein